MYSGKAVNPTIAGERIKIRICMDRAEMHFQRRYLVIKCALPHHGLQKEKEGMKEYFDLRAFLSSSDAPLTSIYTSLSSIARIDSATLAIMEHSIRLRKMSQLNS